MKLILRGSRATAALLLVSSAFAQTFPEVEPNSTKATATPIVGIAAGGAITGTSTGTGVTVGDTLVTTADMFRVKTGALAPGIYLHTLTLTSATAGNVASIRGLTQTAGAPNAGTDLALQASATGVNKWYGFGAQEEIYYRVTGTTASTAQYAATLSTTSITPTAVAGLFNPGPITITTAGQGHTTDTEIYLYDGSLNPVPLGHDDDNSVSNQAKVVASLTAGTYFVAVANYNTANNQGDLNPGVETFLTGGLLDFPNAMVNTSTTTALNVAFSVSDGATTTPVAATHANAFDVVWGTITVQVNTNPPANDNCANAQSIVSGTYGGVLTYATHDGTASCDPGGAGSKDAWFSFTDPSGSGGTLSLNTCGTSGADTVLSVYASCGGTELACNDDCGGAPCAGPTSCLTTVLAPGQNVKIRVSDKGLGAAAYTLTSSYVGNPPLNDSCATPIAIGPGTYGFDTTLATTGVEGQGATVACGTTSSVKNDLWYTYTAGTNGSVTISTCGLTTSTNDDTKISYYAGAGCPVNPSPIGCDDDACVTPTFNTILTFNVLCGEVYTIQLGNYAAGGNTAGSFSVMETGTTCSTPSTPFCLGDGTGTPCPCSPTPNNGAPGHGCGSLAFPGGAILTSTGIASDETGVGTTDTLSLVATDVPGPTLFIQANGLAGSPIPFGDGQLCAAFGIIRLGVVFPGPPSPVNVATYPGGLTPNEIHIQGLASAGQTKYYQAWYRSVPGVCTAGQNYDLTQGISLLWGN